MTQVVDRNWYSPESKKAELAAANIELNKMKALEKRYQRTRHQVIEPTLLGKRIRYIKKE